MKKGWYIGIFLASSMFLLGAHFFSDDSASNTDAPIKIGVIVSLTGKGADRGELVLEALESAKRYARETKLTKRPIELYVQDVPLDGMARAPIAYQALVDLGVDAVIGPMGSGPASTVAPLAANAEIPTIVHSASAKTISGHPFVLRLWPTAPQYAEEIHREIARLGYTKIALITSTHENTTELRETLLMQFGNTVEIVADEQVSAEAHDMRTQLAKIAQSNPDVVILNVFEGQFKMAALQARSLGVRAPFVANAVFSERELEGVDTSVFQGTWFPRFLGWNVEAVTRHQHTVSESVLISDSAAAAYDALLMVVQAIEHGKNAGDVDAYMRRGTFTGAIGTYSFTEHGDANVPLVLKEVSGGTIVDRVRRE